MAMVSAVLGGCADADPMPDAPVGVAGGTAGTEGLADEALRTMTPESAAFLPGRVASHAQRKGEFAGGRELSKRGPSPDGAGVTVVKAMVRSGATEPVKGTLSVMRFRMVDEGLALEETDEHADGVRTVFEPPLLAVPARLKLGESVVQRVSMKVYPFATPGRLKTRGEGTNTIAFEAVEPVEAPAGDFTAQRVRTTLELALGEAKVRVVTLAWYVPGVGAVVERSTERVTVLGVPIRSVVSDLAMEPAGRSEGAGEVLDALLSAVARDQPRP
jgi:hypothetical protein